MPRPVFRDASPKSEKMLKKRLLPPKNSALARQSHDSEISQDATAIGMVLPSFLEAYYNHRSAPKTMRPRFL